MQIHLLHLNKRRKKYWISVCVLFFMGPLYAQQKVDTNSVIIKTAEEFLYWAGYNNQQNDTTLLVKSVIGRYNKIADSILAAKQLEDRIVYTKDLIQDYKSQYFSLIALNKLLDSNHFRAEKINNAFANFVDKENASSLMEQYVINLGDRRNFVTHYYKVISDSPMGTGWNTGNQNTVEAFEKTFQFIGMASGKPVTVLCGSGRNVYYDGNFGGPSGVELVLWKGKTHIIEVKENNIVRCRHELLIASTDDGSPITLTCNNQTPCSCQQ